MQDNLITSYSEYIRTGYTIEDFYQFCLENDEDFSYTKDEFISKFQSSNDFYQWLEDEWSDLWEMFFDDVSHEANIILGTKDFVKVEGFSQRWNGSRNVDTVIREIDLQEIISKYINADMIEVDVYEDRVELRNIHHDGTNHYTLTAFSYSDLKKSELLELISKEDYEYYGDKLYKATKDDLVIYLNDNLE